MLDERVTSLDRDRKRGGRLAVLSGLRLLRWSIEHQGLGNTLAAIPGHLRGRAAYRLAERLDGFDRRYRASTSDGVDLASLDLTREQQAHAFGYQACAPWVLRRMFRTSALDPARTAFVDLGCGKGRALMVAAELPFAKIVGVELSPRLLSIAEDNAARIGLSRRAGFELVRGDVVDTPFPDEDLLVFIFNAFDTHALGVVLERLRDSLRASPRAAYLGYQADKQAYATLDACPWLSLVTRESVAPVGAWAMGTWSLWRVEGNTISV